MNPEKQGKPPTETFPDLLQRLAQAMRLVRPAAWVVFLTACLVLFLAWMPSHARLVLWRALAARGTVLSMLLAFGLLAVSLVWSFGQRIDVWAFLFFNLRGQRPIWLDRAMLGLTQMGSGIFALGIGLVLYVAGERLAAYGFILGTLTLWIVVELIKALVRRSRPFIRVAETRVVGSRIKGRSFPSGHTSQAFFMATLLARQFHAGAGVVLILYAMALLVGITRMYVGAHYPRDVLAGVLLGSAWGFLGTLVGEAMLNGPI